MVSSWTHTIPACENILRHNPKVIKQCKRRRSIISLLLHMMHQSRLRALKGLLNCNMSMVFTILCVTNQGKAINSTSILQRKHIFANWFSKQKKLTFGNTQEFKIMSKGKGINFHGSKTDKGYDYWNTILQLLPNYSISDIPPHQIILQSWGKDSTISNYQSLKRLKKHKSSNPTPPPSKPKKKNKIDASQTSATQAFLDNEKANVSSKGTHKGSFSHYLSSQNFTLTPSCTSKATLLIRRPYTFLVTFQTPTHTHLSHHKNINCLLPFHTFPL